MTSAVCMSHLLAADRIGRTVSLFALSATAERSKCLNSLNVAKARPAMCERCE
jgi:hypothetical protein